MLTAGEEETTELKSNGVGAENGRKQECKRFHCERLNAEKDRERTDWLSTSSRFSDFYHSPHRQAVFWLLWEMVLYFLDVF